MGGGDGGGIAGDDECPVAFAGFIRCWSGGRFSSSHVMGLDGVNFGAFVLGGCQSRST